MEEQRYISKLNDKYIMKEVSRVGYFYYYLEPIKWQVLDIDNNKALLISEDVVMRDLFPVVKGELEWARTDVRSFLNGYSATENASQTDYTEYNFYDIAFSDTEKEAIIETEIVEKGLTTNNKVFIPSIEEFEYYQNSDIISDMKSYCWRVRDSKENMIYVINSNFNELGAEVLEWEPEVHFSRGLKLAMYVDLSKMDLTLENAIYVSELNKNIEDRLYTNMVIRGTESEWAKKEISEATKLNIIKMPNDIKRSVDYKSAITREYFCELAVQVYLLSNKDMAIDIKTISPFKDTSNPAIILASELGIVSGRGNGIFDSYACITRQEAASMLARLADVINVKTNTKPLEFKDKAEIAKYALKAVDIVTAIKTENEYRVMQGVSNDEFNPLGDYSVEQAVATLLRLYKQVD